MTDDMIKEHLVRAHLAESVTLDAGTWTEVLEEVLRLRELHELYKDKTERLRELHELYKDKTERLREVSYDLLGELTAHRAAQSLRQASEDLRSRTTARGPVAWVYPEGLEALKSGKPWTAYGNPGNGPHPDGVQRIALYLNESVIEGLQVGNFTLSRYDEGSYWLAHKDGEGMQVRQERLQTLVDELWKEF